jgi:hypothetical protein
MPVQARAVGGGGELRHGQAAELRAKVGRRSHWADGVGGGRPNADLEEIEQRDREGR